MASLQRSKLCLIYNVNDAPVALRGNTVLTSVVYRVKLIHANVISSPPLPATVSSQSLHVVSMRNQIYHSKLCVVVAGYADFDIF